MRGLRAFLADRSSGAAELAREALEYMEAERAKGTSPAQLRRLAERMIRAHAAMGAVWNAVHASDPAAFRRQLENAQREIVRQARLLLPRSVRVVTLSYSSTVLAALSRRDLTVTVAASEPGGEGRVTARRLRRAGVKVEVVPDSVLATALQSAQLAVVGADAVTPEVVVNKVGTRLLAAAAHELGRPCYVLADQSKFVPSDWKVPPYRRGSPFEATPRSLFAGIVTDRP